MFSCFPIPSLRTLLHITVSIICFLGVATSRRTQNFTIEVPYGTTNHGDPYSLCTPATFIDIASFLLFNYVAHGATVVSYPGEPAFDSLLNVAAAILFPTFGFIRALNFIMRHPLLTAKNDLEVTARSGALCMLVRSSSWKPQKGDNIRNALIEDPGNEHLLRGHNISRSDPSANIPPTYVIIIHILGQLDSQMNFLLYQSTATLSIYTPPWLNDRTRFWSYTDTDLVEIGSRVVFGLSKPPDQYKFVFVPRNTEVLGLVDPTPTPSSNVPKIPLLRYLYRIFASPVSTTKLSSSFNLLKGVAALRQLLYASFTLYRTTGGQVDQYGFAAPGFTVLPYAAMSALNLAASLVAPHYPKLYLVRSKVMEEAERRTGLPFYFVVGKVVDESDTNNIVKEGWSEIAGSFKYDDKVLCVTPSPSVEEDETIGICDGSSQRIYVPACPRFRRTDDTQTSPLRQFDETRPDGLVFPQYMARRRQAPIQPSLFSFSRLPSQLQSCVRTFRPHINYIRLPQRPQRPQCNVRELNAYERFLVIFITVVEFEIILMLSELSGQQSTLAQRAWTVTWLMAGCIIGATISFLGRSFSIAWKSDVSPVWVSFVVCCLILIFSVPAIGGFVVVFQMLKAYGICYKFV